MTESRTADAPAQSAAEEDIEIDHVVSQPLSQIWQRLITPEGVEALLGEGARLGGKGEPWHAADGTYGVTRSYHPFEQIRVSWHADADAPATLVDLQFFDHPDGTRLNLRHEHLAEEADREELRLRWEGALSRLAGA